MKLVFDARHLATPHSGLARYASSILLALLRRGGWERLEILVPQGLPKGENPHWAPIRDALHADVEIRETDIPAIRVAQHARMALLLSGSRYRDHTYFYPHFDLPLLSPLESVFVVHDLLPLVVPEYVQRWPLVKKFYFKHVIRANLARERVRCVAVSHSTRDDVVRLIGGVPPERIRVAYEGPLLAEASAGAWERPGLAALAEAPFLLYVGDRRPHKNLRRMIDAFEVLRKGGYPGRFLLVGNPANFDFDVDSYIATRPSVVAVPFLPDADLTRLYRKTDALFFLSRYEGFGLSIVEAARFNCRIITSARSSTGEIAPPTALLLDPDAPAEELAVRIAPYLRTRPDLNVEAYLANYSWETSVERIFFSPDTR